MLAAREGCTATVGLLLERGAAIEAKGNLWPRLRRDSVSKKHLLIVSISHQNNLGKSIYIAMLFFNGTKPCIIFGTVTLQEYSSQIISKCLRT